MYCDGILKDFAFFYFGWTLNIPIQFKFYFPFVSALANRSEMNGNQIWIVLECYKVIQILVYNVCNGESHAGEIVSQWMKGNFFFIKTHIFHIYKITSLDRLFC